MVTKAGQTYMTTTKSAISYQSLFNIPTELYWYVLFKQSEVRDYRTGSALCYTQYLRGENMPNVDELT